MLLVFVYCLSAQEFAFKKTVAILCERAQSRSSEESTYDQLSSMPVKSVDQKGAISVLSNLLNLLPIINQRLLLMEVTHAWDPVLARLLLEWLDLLIHIHEAVTTSYHVSHCWVTRPRFSWLYFAVHRYAYQWGKLWPKGFARSPPLHFPFSRVGIDIFMEHSTIISSSTSSRTPLAETSFWMLFFDREAFVFQVVISEPWLAGSSPSGPEISTWDHRPCRPVKSSHDGDEDRGIPKVEQMYLFLLSPFCHLKPSQTLMLFS